MERKLAGRYVVTDPEICHGTPTFRGTRIFVADVLDMVAQGMDWDAILQEWHGHITKEAIAEAVSLASQVFMGSVLRVTPTGIAGWRIHPESEIRLT